MSITSSLYSFHIVVMNFIVTLLDELNSIFTVTCKFFRRIFLIADKIIYSVNQWINALLNRLLITNWNIFVVFIFDRDFKFMFDMWQTFFLRLNTKLFMSIAYHSQTNNTSKRTNQTIEIVIRFFIINYSNINFVLILSSLQIQFNNFVNVVIDLSLNEINYDFKIRDALFNLSNQSKTISVADFSIQRLKYRREAADVSVFVNVKVKIYYDARHTSLFLKIDDYAFFRLHQNYQLFDRFNKKTSQQRCDFFFIKRRVERLIYELNLLFVWRVHSVISVTQLKFVSSDENFYRRSRFSHFDVVEMKNDTFDNQFYEVEKLVDKRTRKYNRTNVTQYLVRWLNYESKYDKWKNLVALENSMKLMKKYKLTNAEIQSRRRDKKRRNDTR